MRAARQVFAVGLVMILLDLLWLGVLGRPLYVEALGPLMAADVNVVAAGLFYVFYVTTIVLFAVRPARSVSEAGKRGAQLGFVAYTTYELTNWAVIAGWGALIVPIDIVWGVCLTASASAAGAAFGRLGADTAAQSAG
jgi:uncharacterized membrane protein